MLAGKSNRAGINAFRTLVVMWIYNTNWEIAAAHNVYLIQQFILAPYNDVPW